MEELGPPQVDYWPILFVSAVSCHPAELFSSSPNDGRADTVFRPDKVLDASGFIVSRLNDDDSCVRLTTHRRGYFDPLRKSGYRPAGFSFGRVGFAPTGQETEFL